MKVAFDISPLRTGHFLQHQVRGSGFYVQHLQDALQKYESDNQYVFFTQANEIPKDVDIIHYPYFEPFFLTLPWQHKIKTIVTIHDLTPLIFPKAFPSGTKGALKWQIQKNALRRVDHIITDSETSKQDIERLTGVKSERISVVYLASSEEFTQVNVTKKQEAEMIKKYSLPEKFVIFVGDATWNKNLPRIVKAAEKAHVPLVMVGKALVQEKVDASNPWNHDLLLVQRAAENSSYIRRVGFVPTEDLIQLYTIASALVFPSLYEGFGLPILEAMATGCPVITSKEGSLKEVAGDAAFFCDPFSTESIADAITTVVSSEKVRNDLQKKGLAHSRKFSWKKVARETIEVYKK